MKLKSKLKFLLQEIFLCLLGHGTIVQSLCCVSTPAQYFPPLTGGGWSHVRVRVLIPSAHVTEQALHSLHLLQAPSTMKTVRNNTYQQTSLY